jgi:hypothetical protein
MFSGCDKFDGPGSWDSVLEKCRVIGTRRFLVEEWTNYTNLLKHNAIVLKDQDDELKWSLNKSSWVLTTKLGYKAKINEGLGDVSQWWWKLVWKLACPLKIRIFLWISLANKILTWDNGQKRNWIRARLVLPM